MGATKLRVEAALARSRLVARWVLGPRAAQAAVLAAEAVWARAAHSDLPMDQLVAAADDAARLGRDDLAAALYGKAMDGSEHPRPFVLARRRLRGYTGDVPAEVVHHAIEAAFGHARGGRQPIVETRAVPLGVGEGSNVDGVVRHHLTNGGTIVRKTYLGAPPRELLARERGLLNASDGSWRAPRLYYSTTDCGGRWHLFFEDVGRISRPRSMATMITAAHALGEMNGTRAGDLTLEICSPWLADDRRRLRFARPRRADAHLAGVVDDEVRTRVHATLTALIDNEEALTAAHRALPTTFCHGDAVPNNISVGGVPTILIDWQACGRGAVGNDLGDLLRVPGLEFGPVEVARCQAAYREGVAATAPSAPARDEIDFGYRHRFVTLSLRRQLLLLPAPAPSGRAAALRAAAVRAWSGRRRSRVTANLHRICDEAQALLALVR